MLARILAALWLLFAAAFAALVADFNYARVAAATTEGRAWVAWSISLPLSWLALGLLPAVIIIGTRADARRLERACVEPLFVIGASVTPLGQVAVDLLQGPWYGILGFLFRAAIASGVWFTLWWVVFHHRSRKLSGEPALTPRAP